MGHPESETPTPPVDPVSEIIRKARDAAANDLSAQIYDKIKWAIGQPNTIDMQNLIKETILAHPTVRIEFTD